MHPILAHPGRLGAYLAIWVPLGALLAALLAAQGAFVWTAAALVASPLSVCYRFLCLSAWYVTGGSPVERLGALRVAVTAIVSSFLSSAVWLLLVRGWLTVIATTGLAGAPADMTPAFRSAAPIFFGFGFLLYLLAMAVSYLAAAFEVSRDAERARAAGAGARSGAARAAGADRSALPLQQPAVDQRADDGGSGGGAADVPAARGFPARHAGARRARPDSGGARAGAGAAVPVDRAGAVRRSADHRHRRRQRGGRRGAAAAGPAAGRERRHARHRAPARGGRGAHPRAAQGGVAGADGR